MARAETASSSVRRMPTQRGGPARTDGTRTIGSVLERPLARIWRNVCTCVASHCRTTVDEIQPEEGRNEGSTSADHCVREHGCDGWLARGAGRTSGHVHRGAGLARGRQFCVRGGDRGFRRRREQRRRDRDLDRQRRHAPRQRRRHVRARRREAGDRRIAVRDRGRGLQRRRRPGPGHDQLRGKRRQRAARRRRRHLHRGALAHCRRRRLCDRGRRLRRRRRSRPRHRESGRQPPPPCCWATATAPSRPRMRRRPPATVRPPSSTGDFDGDGNADIATANAGDHRSSVLLGNGDGTFTAGAIA